IRLGAVVPITTHLRSTPFEHCLMSRKGTGRKQEREPALRMIETGDHPLDNLIRPRNERFLHEAHARVIEHPETLVLVRVDCNDGVHRSSVLLSEHFVKISCMVLPSR